MTKEKDKLIAPSGEDGIKRYSFSTGPETEGLTVTFKGPTGTIAKQLSGRSVSAMSQAAAARLELNLAITGMEIVAGRSSEAMEREAEHDQISGAIFKDAVIGFCEAVRLTDTLIPDALQHDPDRLEWLGLLRDLRNNYAAHRYSPLAWVASIAFFDVSNPAKVEVPKFALAIAQWANPNHPQAYADFMKVLVPIIYKRFNELKDVVSEEARSMTFDQVMALPEPTRAKAPWHDTQERLAARDRRKLGR